MSKPAATEKSRTPERRALGKGLDSLLPRVAAQPIPSIAAQGDSTRSLEIPIDRIDRNPFQTRMYFDEQALQELTYSIRVSGVLQPVLVRPLPEGRYQLIAGERRWKAAKLADLKTIPAIVHTVSDEEVLEITIIENLQRADLNPLEQAMAFNRLSREFGMNQEIIALRTCKDRATISNYMRLLQLPGFAQDKVASGELSFGHAKVILSLDTEAQMEEAAKRILSAALSVRQAESMVRNMRFGDRSRPSAQSGASAERGQAEAKARIDPNVADAEQRLRNSLGMRVKIEDRNGRGRVIIEYARLEDFDTLVERLA